ncbi:MAG: endopeptidase La [Candidatus Competibacter sp.]|nr:endopeptidase La [Candidatus Competibacter sp.]MDG4605895.1 endopeptidase La [Candidatus Contendobacter sp.]HRD49203.1 endopeptidase La [Candidatus Contendobacter sp.]
MTDHEAIEAEVVREDDNSEASSSTNNTIVAAADILPGTLYLLPLSERPFFPAQALPLLLSEEPWLPTIEAAASREQRAIGLILVKPDSAEKAAGPGDFYEVGTAARMHQLNRNEGRLQFIAQGLKRFRILNWLSSQPPYHVQVEYLNEEDGSDVEELRAYSLAVINTLKELIPLNPLYSEELKFFLNRFNTHDPSPLADFAASLTTASKNELQEILDTAPVLERLKKVIVLIKKELEVAKLQTQIRKQVDEKMSEHQRKFFLREQLKAIQQELGIAKDDRTADVDRFRERLDARQAPEAALKRINEELDKLSILETGSPEYAVTRNYLDAMTELPWGVYSTDNLDLKHAREILNRDHDGLEDVKERIIEFLAVGALKGQVGGSIILLVGPPGVGKTSIGRSVASALDRKFYRLSLGGMRDEAEIKGHRRTYIGALPGKFIQAIREAQTANPVIMLDEIDKIGASFRGDPASALLEVLDPEQNNEFLDHYLDVRFDLSKVLFICTANQLDTIPGPLLDRMESIRLSGYITAEKLQIARNHLWPKLLERSGMERDRIRIGDEALRAIIEGYAREAGVRNLEKQLSRIVRKSAVQIVEGREGTIAVESPDLDGYLGKPPFKTETPMSGVGVVTGLAWTAMGGATLSVEASLVHTKNRGFKLTGRLGEVMQESANIAYSYLSAHLEEYQADPRFFDEAFVHLHVPEGATPKDGPSAGITMATALLSLARGQQTDRPLAMTGELTLTGQVLPVGGIREKLIAARRVGIHEIILPEGCRGDAEELPDHIKEGMTLHFVERFQQVVDWVFTPPLPPFLPGADGNEGAVDER